MDSDMLRNTQARDSRHPLLSVVVPVFNEEETVDDFITAMDSAADGIRDALGPGSGLEVIFIDDGSRDRTVEMISRHVAERTDIALVKLSRNFGKDAALAAGLAEARGDAVIPMDVDLQDPPDVIPEMIAAWHSGAKVVNARRRSRGADSWVKRRSASAFYRLMNRFADHPVQADVGDFRLLDRSVVDVLNTIPERVRFMKSLFSWVGFPQATIHYDRPGRHVGSSKWMYWRLWNFALDGITGSTTLPLRVWTYVGLFVGCLSLLYAFVIIGRTLIFGVDTPGYASLIVTVLFFGAVNMVSIGLLGEYVGRIAVEVRQRPLYIVERRAGPGLSGSDSPAGEVVPIATGHGAPLRSPAQRGSDGQQESRSG